MASAVDPTQASSLTTDTPDFVHRAHEKEASKNDQIKVIDSNTNPNDIREDPKGRPPPLLLSKEEQPVDGVFQNIVNFRDVGLNYNRESGENYMKEGWLFRSGRLDDASTADLKILTEKYGIKTVIDLRSELEGKMGQDLT
ncbi:hypothetical protein HK104_004409, partial [Borealophlyctis nickersoniae]